MKKLKFKLVCLIVVMFGINSNAISQYNQNSYSETNTSEEKVEKPKDKYYDTKYEKFTYKIIGEIHYNDVVQDKDDVNLKGEFDFYKFAVKTGFNFNKKFSVTSKVVAEHTFDPDYDYGDVYVSDLYFKYKQSKKFSVQAGVLTVPNSGGNVGVYGSVVLSPIEKYMSYAWREAGIGVSGKIKKINYKATLTTGLDPYELDSKKVIYKARNHDFFNSLNNVATGIQLYYGDYSSTRVGFSAIYSGLENSGETNTTFEGAYYTFAEIFGSHNFGNLGTRFVGTYSSVNNSEKINKEFYNKVGSEQAGGLVEFTYELSSLLKKQSQRMFVMFRSEYYDSHYRTEGTSDNPKYEHYDYTLGFVFMPIKNLEFKVDYQIQRFSDKYSSQIFDVGIGFQF